MSKGSPKGWMPLGAQVRGAVESRIAIALRAMIEEQRRITIYDGPDEGWQDFVAEGDWANAYIPLIFNSGYIRSLLDLSREFGLALPQDLVQRAELHMSEDPMESDPEHRVG